MLIPESYVADLQARLGLYRRLSTLNEREEIEAFAAELVDRFGPLPEEVKHLLAVVQIKSYCRKAGIAQVEAGPKGAVVAFRNNTFANPSRPGRLHQRESRRGEIQQDHKLVFRADWPDAEERLKGARNPGAAAGGAGGRREGGGMMMAGSKIVFAEFVAHPSPGASRRPFPQGERAGCGTSLPSPLAGKGSRRRRVGEGALRGTNS